MPILVSGRADRVFDAWEQFVIYDICPMTQESCIELIQKLEYDEDHKRKFIEEAIPKLFSDRDRSFVQTPLLAILMLLTYELFADVPEKMHLFYSHAFETLLRGHDVTKSLFRRPLKSGLAEEDFKRLFSSFCAKTYSDKKYEFNYDEIEKYLSIAMDSCSIKSDVRKVVDDLVLSICVMQFESLEYSFVHRSFQEYFTALFLRDSPTSAVIAFLEIGYHPARENVIPMLIGMDRERVEKEWCLPKLEELSTLTQGYTATERAINTLIQLWKTYKFGFEGDSIQSLHTLGYENYRSCSALEVIYPHNSSPWWVDDWEKSENRARLILDAISKNLWQITRTQKKKLPGTSVLISLRKYMTWRYS